MMKVKDRLGTFFFLVGLTLLVIFVGSFLSKDVNILFLLASMTALFLGYQFKRKKEVTDSGRFRLIRLIQEKRRRREEEADKQRKDRDNYQ